MFADALTDILPMHNLISLLRNFKAKKGVKEYNAHLRLKSDICQYIIEVLGEKMASLLDNDDNKYLKGSISPEGGTYHHLLVVQLQLLV